MRVMFIQKEGVPLHHTLIASETSRRALRFYQPEKKTWGVEISVTSLGSALSLVSELRWYIRRYMTAVSLRARAPVSSVLMLFREKSTTRET